MISPFPLPAGQKGQTMPSVNANSQMSQSRMAYYIAKSPVRTGMRDRSTGLNPKGDREFRARMDELMKENGLSSDFAFGQNGEGKFILLQPNANKAKIESLLNSDETLQQIRNDPAHASTPPEAKSGEPSNGSTYYTNGYDSAHFSEEARKMYEEAAKNGEDAPYASSAEDTAAVMEWMAGKESSHWVLDLPPGEEIPIMQTGLAFEAAREAEPLAPEDVAFLKSDKIKELEKTRTWLETEIKAILEESGIDTKDLKGIKLGTNGNGVSVLAGQEGVSKDVIDRINGILSKPENKQLKSVMEKYLGEADSVADELRGVTRMTDADWAEIMAGGKRFSDVDNEGMKALLAADPELESTLASLFNPDSFLSPTQEGSSRDVAGNAARGIGGAVWSAVEVERMTGGMTEAEVDELEKNLKINVKDDGTYEVSGTNNEKILAAIANYIPHYTSGPFAEWMKSGALLNEALGGAKAGSGILFEINFNDRRWNATMQYGDDPAQDVKWFDHV
jgi:hypothetical protein